MEQLRKTTFESLSLKQTGKFSKLIVDLEEDSTKLSGFISHPNSLEGFKAKIEDRKRSPINRELLVNALKSQNSGIAVDSKLSSNLELLLDERTFTITTGHQLNIFTGPIYFHYKILSTIKLCEELSNAFPDYNFVPVYWMNSEDHDLEEVGQVSLFGEKFVWTTDQSGATGRMACNSLVDIAEQLRSKLRSEASLRLLDVMTEAYRTSDSLTEATRKFVNKTYGEQGLVIIDSDDAALKSSFHNIIAKELSESVMMTPIEATSESLASIGYHTQVNPRPINLFYLDDEGRNLIEPEGDDFKIRNTGEHFSATEMQEILESEPQRLSYNVVSRPLFQEFLLPNLAYVGGGGELAYWLQYKKMFGELNVSFPILALRDSFLMIDGRTAEKLEEFGISIEQLFQDEELLVNSFLANSHSVELDVSELHEKLNGFYDSLSEKASELDKGLKTGVEAERAKQLKTLTNWESKFRRSLKSKSEVSVNRLRKIHRQLFPNGGLQERSMNILEAIERFGPDFLEQTKAHEEPLSTNRYAVVKF